MYHQKLLMLKPDRPQISKSKVISQSKKLAKETESFAKHTKEDPFEIKRKKEEKKVDRYQMFRHD